MSQQIPLQSTLTLRLQRDSQTDRQTELFRRYPKLFRKPGKRLVDPEVISEFEERLQDDKGPFDERGIECGDGWFALVDRLVQQ